MFFLLSYRMYLNYLPRVAASSGDMSSKMVDKKLFRSNRSTSIFWGLSVYLLLLSKLAVLSSTARLPDHDNGELPCILLSTRALTLQLKTTTRYFPGKIQDASSARHARGTVLRKFVVSSCTKFVPREHVCSGPIPIIPLGHLSQRLFLYR